MEEEIMEPVSPTGQYFTSSVISVSIIAVLEFEFPFDDSQMNTLLKNVLLPINPRFSSLMVKDKNGKKHWKKVEEVNVNEHVNVPIFPEGKSPEFYEDYLSEYLSKIGLEQFPEGRPLWEVHIIKYPTKNAAGNLVFKLSHALGDGYSLMGALLSCLQRADNPHLPLTFPSFNKRIIKTNIIRKCFYSVCDFVWGVLKSSVLEDDESPIRSGDAGVEFRPFTVTTLNFSLDHIKKVKASLHDATVNDVICGGLFLGIRLYMKSMKYDQTNAKSTAIVALNTRNIGGYKSISDMVKPDAESPWGNQVTILYISVPQLALREPTIDPLSFVLKAHKMIKRKKSSAAVVLTAKFLEALRKFRGPEVIAEYTHSTLKKTSLSMSNMMGPVEQMALSNQPVKGMYFIHVGIPQSQSITIMSYMGQLRVALATKNELIDAHKFKSCVQNAFDMIFAATIPFPSV